MPRPRALVVGLLVLALATAGCLGPEDGTDSEDVELTNASASPAPSPPEAELSANRTAGSAPLDVAFQLDAEGNVSWSLATGDGASAQGEELPAVVDHTYEEAGNYTANLTVETEHANDSDTLAIHVEPAPSETEDAETNETDGGDGEDDADEDSEEEHVDESPNCSRFVPAPADPTGMGDWEPRTLEVAFAVDAAFAQRAGNWRSVVQDHVQAMSAIYEKAVATEVEPVHIVAIPGDELAVNGTTGEAIEDLRAYYDERYPDLHRDAVYLFSGGDFSNAAGQAACIGGAGYIDDAYAVGEAIHASSELGPFTLAADRAVKIATHEVGHLLAAHHHQANCSESAPNYDPTRPTDACTIMINVANLAEPTFSTPNRLVMRSHVDTIADGTG